jgi:sugar phosphate isomerase/epimerase
MRADEPYRATRSLGVMIAIAILGCTFAADATASSTKAIWGPVQLPDGSSAFPVYKDLGVKVLQLHLNWSGVAPHKPSRPEDPADPAYRWPADVNEAVATASRYGIKVALMVHGSPPWANGGRPPQWVPRNEDYARFLEAASRRYPTVRTWMIWGEANRAAVFQPLPANRPAGPRRYATLLAAAYGALKSSNPRNVVVGGMTFSFGDVRPRDFARWMRLPSGRPAPLDLYGHNPFTRRFPNLQDSGYRGYPGARDFGDIDTFYSELRGIYRGRYRRFSTRGPRLWLSEFTISSDRPNRSFDFFVTRRQQATWLSAAYRIAQQSSFVAGLGWWSLLDEPASQERGQTTGLMTYEGKRKPAYYAYRHAR